MAVVQGNEHTFQQEIQSEKLVLVDFWAEWCPPCRALSPVLEELDQEMGEYVKIVKVNADDNPRIASQYGIMSLPTLLIFQNGKPVDRIVGFQTKETLKNLLQRFQ